MASLHPATVADAGMIPPVLTESPWPTPSPVLDYFPENCHLLLWDREGRIWEGRHVDGEIQYVQIGTEDHHES